MVLTTKERACARNVGRVVEGCEYIQGENPGRHDALLACCQLPVAVGIDLAELALQLEWLPV